MGDDIEMVDDCIFCKIIRGEIPSIRIYADDRSFAFMDINPVAPGHCLVVPRHHAENIFTTPPHASAAAMATVSRVAKAVDAALRPDGINVLQANGPGANQSVFHTHFHVLPRSTDDGLTMNWGLNPGDMDEISVVAEKIRAELK